MYRMTDGINGMPMEMAEFIKSIVDYFVSKGWKDIYAWNLVYKHSQNMALKKLEEAIKIDYSPFPVTYDKDSIRIEYIQLIHSIIDALSTYLPDDRKAELQNDLEMIVFEHCKKWGL